jgi:hypothetical protein
VVTAWLTAKPLCSRVKTVKTTVATVVVLAAIVLTIVVVLAVAVAPLALMARRLMAATSLLLPLTPSAFARQLLLLKRKENKHVAT